MTFISYAQNFEDVMLWRALKDVKDGFYIDIGSERPFTDSVSYGFSLVNWQGISVEVNPQYYQEFKNNRPYDKIVQALISDKYEKLKFYIFKDTGLSTADENFAKMHINDGLPYEVLEVESMLLDDIFKCSRRKDIHWLKIDVEGFEKNVLKGWHCDVRPWILVIEAMIPNKQISTHEDWEYILIDKGYNFVYSDGLNRFYVSNDHKDLEKHFYYPPNPLQDDYVSISHHHIGAMAHRALQAEKQLCEKEKHLATLDLEIIKKESSLNKSNNWAKSLEKQIFVQQEYLKDYDQQILNLSKNIEEQRIWITSLEVSCQNYETRFRETEALALENQNKLHIQEERAIQAEALALENENKLHIQEERAIEHQERIAYLEKILNDIYKSRSWRITYMFRSVNVILQKCLMLLKEKIKSLINYSFKIVLDQSYKNPKFKRLLLITDKNLPGKIRNILRQFYYHKFYQKNIIITKQSPNYGGTHKKFTFREKEPHSFFMRKNQKKKLAYVSPLPPEQTGIADYSAELIPVLEKHYEIDLIVQQDHVIDSRLNENFNIYGPQYLKENYQQYDRILYHAGNSPFHIYIFDLLKTIPGVVVLHDFYLSNVEKYLSHIVFGKQYFQKSLYNNHGYHALSYFSSQGEDQAVLKYPCSLFVFKQALGVIFHSEFSKKLAYDWYRYKCSNTPIPLLRCKCSHDYDKEEIKEALGFSKDSFIITSFGFLGQTKLNAVLLDVFLGSALRKETNCYLIFVGGYSGDYALNILQKVKKNKMKHRILFTDWTDGETYQNYLKISDMSVQLRSSSRGESSAAVLDCMNYGISTIINENGAMAEIPSDVVIKIPNHFKEGDLKRAVENLYYNDQLRRDLGAKASAYIEKIRSPETCAQQYFEQIEAFYHEKNHPLHVFDDVLSEVKKEKDILECMPAVNKTLFKTSPVKSFFVDISVLVKQDLKTGIERVTRGLLTELLRNPPSGYNVEPVYATPGETYRYARAYTSQFLGISKLDLEDEFIDHDKGDIFFLLDWAVETTLKHQDYLLQLKNQGVKMVCFMHDILPITRAEFFPKNMDYFREWINVLTKISNQIICNSKSVAQDVETYIQKTTSDEGGRIKIEAINLGSNIENSHPSKGLPGSAAQILSKIKKKISFLMVGTIEPRKGHLYVIEAFSSLWKEGHDFNLVIVGKIGWDKEIQVAKTMRHHAESNNKLFWLEGISDEYLSKIYDAATCLIAASEAEGYGLPIIEAANHGLPVIARNIPVFQEVSQGFVHFFDNSKNAFILQKAILEWIELYHQNLHPCAKDIKTITWAESAQELIRKITKD